VTPEPGQIIGGKYALVRPLAAGGMGSVWVARHTGLDVEVAIKRMSPALASDAVARARFEREAKAAARLKSPYVVQVHDFGVDGGAPYIAMELLAGEDLGALLERSGRLSLARAAAIFTQACKGVKAAHEAGIVHRDIKPSNIFLARMGDDEVVKILDFGIARPSEPVSGTDKTASGILVGTPLSMSPEQARGAEAGPATDLWSLAVVLHFAVTGRLPFSGATMAEILAAILRDPPPPASRFSPDLPPSLDRFFEKAMAKEPDARFASATRMADAFAALVSESPPSHPTSQPGASSDRDLELAPTVDAPRPAGTALNTPAKAPVSGPASATGQDETVPAAVAPTAAPALTAALPPVSVSPSDAVIAKTTSGDPAPRSEASAPVDGKRRGGLVVALAAAVLVLVGLRSWPAATPGTAAVASGAASVSAAVPRPTAITDLPQPLSSDPRALAAYMGALQSFRDANWDHGTTRLQEAVALDPEFAAAHLRLAISQFGDLPGARQSHTRAVQGRMRLSDRDRTFLAAIEPALRDPPDRAAALALARKAVQAHPLDAELWLYQGSLEADVETATKCARRAVELDPGYADAWSSLANAFLEARRHADALDAADRCLAIAPTSVDCLTQRASAYKWLGRCADMEPSLRQALALNPKAAWPLKERVEVLTWLRRPRETLLEAFRQKWAAVPEAKRAVAELEDRADLDLAWGDFAGAEAKARELGRLIEDDLDIVIHLDQAHILIQAAWETGRAGEAARLADEYLKRRGAWQGQDTWAIVPMLHTMARGGLLSKQELAARRSAWLASHGKPEPPRGPWDVWIAVYAYPTATPEEAAEAVLAMPGGPLTEAPPDAAVARVLQLAGRSTEAVEMFRRAQNTCSAHSVEPRASWHFGQALEQTGDVAGACAAYATVLDAWGAARPRSMTAEKARARVAALRCPAGTK
jgi:serine/threonine protein kinase/tetratricopeptide (TPR) repeat protein